MPARLVYVMDPLCGWCFGASAALLDLQRRLGPRVPWTILPGGMWAGPRARPQSAPTAQFIREHDRQIAAATGAVFGQAYWESLDDPTRVLDSGPPARALVVASGLAPERALEFASAVQRARFVEGQDLNRTKVYLKLCADMGLDSAAFIRAYDSPALAATLHETFAEAARYAHGYPTLLWEDERGARLIAEGYAPADTLEVRARALLPAAFLL